MTIASYSDFWKKSGSLQKTYPLQDRFKITMEGIVVAIKVIPKAHWTELVGWENGELKIRLAAAPEPSLLS